MGIMNSDRDEKVSLNPNSEIKIGGKLHPNTSLGYVHLTISDLDRSVSFYQHSLGFQIHHQENSTIYLGAGGKYILALTEITGAKHLPRRTGLYHFAILTPSRKALARTIKYLIETETALQGGANHLVSEAVYLSDPDGNGIDVYRDRPRSEWKYENGSLKMGTDPLDYQGLLNELSSDHGEWRGLKNGTWLGHMHLHVADLAQATEFYENVLGFDFIIDYRGSASFLSVGGYHHHIGLNIWNDVVVPPPPPGSAGMRYFTLNLVDDADRQRLLDRLVGNQVPYETVENGFLVRDPSQNGILFEVDHQI